MIIQPTEEMIRYYRELERKGRLFRSGAYAAKGYADEALAKLTPEAIPDPVRRSRIRLEMQGAPLRYKQAAPAPSENAPTHERRAKAGSAIERISERARQVRDATGRIIAATEDVVRGYKIKDIIEQHGDKFEFDHRSALERFKQDSSYALRVAVPDWNRSSGGSSPGTRLGGLGSVPQHVRDGHARAEWVWKRIPPKFKRVALALVLMRLEQPNGTFYTMEDFGAEMFSNVKDRNRRWGASAGAIWGFAECLVFFYQQCPIRVRPIDDEERYLEDERESA